ncbi:MAG TPA: hypothetical protein VF546_24990 [Pyrinomonadaceae bacterium]|jgi:hypothetical protein
MTEGHLTGQQVEAYRRRAVAAGERGALDRHLAACDACLRRVVDTTHPHIAVTALTEALLPATDEEPFHLSRAELKRYAAGALDRADRVIFESHLEDCAECNSHARELASSNTGRAPKTVWERFSGWQFPTLRPAQVGVIALACVCVLLGTLWLRSRFADGRNQAAPSQVAGNAQAPNQTITPPREDQPGQQPAEANGNNNDEAASLNPTASRQGQIQDAPEVVVSLIDGSRKVTLDKRGQLTGLEGLDASTRREVAATLSGDGLSKPAALDALTAPRITLLDQSATVLPFRLLSPVGVIIVEGRPTFRWQPLRGATSYAVSVFDANFNRVLSSGPQTAARWSPPTPLRAGAVYFWEVTARRDEREITSPVAPAPRAQFKILEADKVREIERAQGAHPDSHLVLGILYARAGLLTDAEREFRLLTNANPRSQVAAKLLRRVQSWKKP